MIRVEGKPGLARDPNSGAILNINSAEIRAAKARKIAMAQEEERKKRSRRRPTIRSRTSRIT